MFSNIGGKIKILAQIICWVGIIVSVILGILLIVTGAEYESAESILIGIIWMILGALFSWVGSFTLYGFGEIIDQLTMVNENTYETNMLLRGGGKAPVASAPKTFVESAPMGGSGEWYCTLCGHKNPYGTRFCTGCGRAK